MHLRKWITTLLLCAATQAIWSWDGNGTTTDPYLVQNSDDWKQLGDDVAGGKDYADKVFRMTADIDALGRSVGQEGKPFRGIFDGDSHTLTYNKGSLSSYEMSDEYCAPFVQLEGATVRHLRVTGSVLSRHQWTAGIVARIDGAKATVLSDCHVSSKLVAGNGIDRNTMFGGLVGEVNSTCQANPIIRDCSFTGSIDGWANNCGGMVGWTSTRPVTFCHCMFAPMRTPYSEGNATYIRTSEGMVCPMTECYFTQAMGLAQGEAVFQRVNVPEGCTWRIVSKPDLSFNGKDYWRTGAQVELKVSEGTPFNHWEANTTCYISDPWTSNGIHVISDIRAIPSFTIMTAMGEAKMERTMDGTRYRYLGATDYHLYLPKAYCDQKGYYLDGDGWLVKMVNGKKVYVTAVTGWVDGSIPSNGAQIHNDLTGDWRDHTLMACIAPHAFQGCQELKHLYFKDTDANNYNAMTELDFIIGDYAFADCPNLTEIKLMQYTTRGDNHWEALKESQVGSVGSHVFSGSQQARFSTDASEYQKYMGSTTWKELTDRIIVYNHTTTNMKVNGACYGYFRDTKGDPIKNNEAGHNTLMETLQLWNGQYQQLNAVTLLAEQDAENIWYTQVVGADDDYLKSNNGVMRIYNDPGSYYNYKTLTIARNAFKDDKELKTIEFWQTNGRSENSYSDLKIIIQNGAFAGCDNLRELRMFYYAQDGDDHWEVLRPTQVIPGDNLFGIPTAKEAKTMTEEQFAGAYHLPSNFKILVSPAYYLDFISDPNWAPYSAYIEPVEYDPDGRHGGATFDVENISYGYMTSPGGLATTSQVVTADFSWWSLPKIAWNVFSNLSMVNSVVTAVSVARTAARQSAEVAAEQAVRERAQDLLMKLTMDMSGRSAEINIKNTLLDLAYEHVSLKALGLAAQTELTSDLIEAGIVNSIGEFTYKYINNEVALAASYSIREGLTKAIVDQTQRINSIIFSAGARAAAGEVANQAGMTAAVYLSVYAGFGAWGKMQASPGIDVYREKGMRANLMSNIHNFGSAGDGWVYYTPEKNLVYHTYITNIPNNLQHAKITTTWSKGVGINATARTSTCSNGAFHNKTQLKKITFHDSSVTSNTAMPFCFSLPDSAFVGCTALEELDLLLKTENGSEYALGPENFILCGDNVFEGLDSTKFHIVIDPARKQDFMDNETWAPLERFFTYRNARPKNEFEEYGVGYAYAYEGNSIKKERRVGAHLVENILVNSVNHNYLSEHSGTASIINDPGTWNNYQVDYIAPWAFRGETALRNVQFIDLKGWGPFGESYSDLNIMLTDSCFANCPSLESVDLLYGVTDQDMFLVQMGGGFESNHIMPMTTDMIKIGKGVFEGSPKARLKMTQRQVALFKSDKDWAPYADRFLPCVFTTDDEGVKEALDELCYHNPSGTSPSYWDDYIDASNLLGKPGGFNWLGGRFTDEKDELRTFTAFKCFETVGLDFVGYRWFADCTKLNDIWLPSTIKRIGKEAFMGCTTLEQIELPAGLQKIEANAFKGCSALKVIIVNNPVPCTMSGENHFPLNENMRIYVPDHSLEIYLADEKWIPYSEYLTGMSNYKVNKHITVTQGGQLAEKLGVTLEFDKATFAKADKVLRYVHGDYTRYDSLTISGPLNGTDLAVIRYLAGCESWNYSSSFTEGKLRYLNLYDAKILKDTTNPYAYVVGNWLYTEEDNTLFPNAFYKCESLETVILPRSLKGMYVNVFKGCKDLKKLAFCSDDVLVYGKHQGDSFEKWLSTMISYGSVVDEDLDELVLYTEKTAICTSLSDPWDHNIKQVYTLPDMLNKYQGRPELINRTRSIVSLFESRSVTDRLAMNGQFFPSDFLKLEHVEDIFQNDTTLESLGDFYLFKNVRHLDETFMGCTKLSTITLPDSLQRIGASAFKDCRSLCEVHISTDAIPLLEENAFEDQVAQSGKDFHIYVPKNLCKLYRQQWSQYADYINIDYIDYSTDSIIVVTTTEVNTLAQKLGLHQELVNIKLPIENHNGSIQNAMDASMIVSLTGKYDHIKRLKVVGPISGNDLCLLRFLSGWCPWANTRNYMGQLEYLDLYDAQLVKSNGFASHDKFLWSQGRAIVIEDNVLPPNSFLKCYNLKTLILPRTCTKVETRALLSCESLEVLVVGDDCTDFNWNALDDDVCLTRLYLLSRQKPKLSTDSWLTRMLSNNYNPTFDAVYVRPSMLPQYQSDPDYTDKKWQRTNLISRGAFADDESFCAFAAHAAATVDDISGVTSIHGWFNTHKGARDLTPLRYCKLTSIDKSDMQQLTRLEEISIPSTVKYIGEESFINACRLRYVDFLPNDSLDMTLLRQAGLKQLGIDTQRTLVYMPQSYGPSDETNVVVNNGSTLNAKNFRLVDSLSYMVPYDFETETIENSRQLAASIIPYTVCLPYRLKIPAFTHAYTLSKRDANSLVFTESFDTDQLEPMRPYLLKVIGNKRLRCTTATLGSDIPQTVLASGGSTYGRQDNAAGYALRGTFDGISNSEAAQLGAYILQSDANWHPVLDGMPTDCPASILPYRAFLLPRANNSREVIGMTLDDDANGIDTIETIDADGTHQYYDLQGRQLPGRPQRGLFIHNGKKHVNK